MDVHLASTLPSARIGATRGAAAATVLGDKAQAIAAVLHQPDPFPFPATNRKTRLIATPGLIVNLVHDGIIKINHIDTVHHFQFARVAGQAASRVTQHNPRLVKLHRILPQVDILAVLILLEGIFWQLATGKGSKTPTSRWGMKARTARVHFFPRSDLRNNLDLRGVVE